MLYGASSSVKQKLDKPKWHLTDFYIANLTVNASLLNYTNSVRLAHSHLSKFLKVLLPFINSLVWKNRDSLWWSVQERETGFVCVYIRFNIYIRSSMKKHQ